MTIKTSTKAPTKAQIESHTRDDLREVYLLSFDQFAITPTDVVINSNDRINSRYARELLGVLTQAGMLTVEDVNGEEDVWQVANPGTYDDHTRDEAESAIAAWLDEKVPATTATTSTGETITVAKPATPKAVKNPTGQCRCGCGENVAKSHYRPGHDARHAGNVARSIAADGNWADLDALPSDKLQQKATDMANRLMAKANTKSVPKEPTPPPVVQAKVGRATYEGVVDGDTFHYVDAKGNEKQAAKFTLV